VHFKDFVFNIDKERDEVVLETQKKQKDMDLKIRLNKAFLVEALSELAQSDSERKAIKVFSDELQNRASSSKPAEASPDLSVAGLFKSDPQLTGVDRKKWSRAVSNDRIEKAKKAFEEKKINVTVVGNKQDALKALIGLIPEGASVMNAGSTTLQEIGYTEYAKTATQWNNLHTKILAEKDQGKAAKLRNEAMLADYFLSSVSAITESGDILACDFTGTRVGAFYQAAGNLVLVVGHQKIVPTLDTAFQRQSEYCLPLESARSRVAYKVPGSAINNIAVISGSNPWGPTRIHVIIVKETLGF